MLRLHYLAGLALLVLSLAAVSLQAPRSKGPRAEPPMPAGGLASGTDGALWFQVVKPFCNALEVESATTRLPAPHTLEGSGYAAACFAIAGRIDRARELLHAVAPARRWRAAGIVFEIGHPIADAGDDRSAGPIMELVAEFWPNHYMALYHAGAAEFDLGQTERARTHLQAFLKTYDVEDGWRESARDMLSRIDHR
jgi:hypothetical protein